MNKALMFAASLIGFAGSAAVLILLLPSLFEPGGGVNGWLVGLLAVLAVIFAVGMRRLRPPSSPGTH